MIKVTTFSGTEYVIDEEQERVKRIPARGTELSSILRGFLNSGEWQPYIRISALDIESMSEVELKVGANLWITYLNEQNWSFSTEIIKIDHNFQEE